MPYFLRVLAADPGHFRMFIRYGANAERAHPADRHWYLVVAGVRPEAQRQGLGSRLMRHELATADSDGIPVYMETADRANIAYSSGSVSPSSIRRSSSCPAGRPM